MKTRNEFIRHCVKKHHLHDFRFDDMPCECVLCGISFGAWFFEAYDDDTPLCDCGEQEEKPERTIEL